MPVDTTHTEYDSQLKSWQRARDVLAGEDRIKEEGPTYVPLITSMDTAEFARYIQRGFFFNASGRTVQGLAGMIFNQDPITKSEGKTLDDFLQDSDLSGCSFYSYSMKTVEEVISIGRAGSLVDWNETEARPNAAFYCTESIINWSMGRVGGRRMLKLLVLKECVELEDIDPENGEYSATEQTQYRVFRLDPVTENLICEVWTPKESKSGGEKQVEYELTKTIEPKRRGKPLTFIPFVFHNVKKQGAEVDKPPLDDLYIANVNHFALSVEFRHGLHYTGLPTAWVSGFDKDAELKIGAGVAWQTDNIGATAGFLEFTGQGLASFTTEMDKVEKQMAVLGARMLEEQPGHAVSAETIRLRGIGENSSLTKISGSCSTSLSQVLKLASWWYGNQEKIEDITDEQASVELNTNFVPAKLTPEEITALIKAYQSGAITKETMVWNMKQGGILEPSRTVDDELAKLASEPLPTLPSPAAKPAPKPGSGAA